MSSPVSHPPSQLLSIDKTNEQANALIVPIATQHAQQRAAAPQSSVWVSANAGSGKTRVLTDRVLRLLLSGVSPSQILCLTYTKAAAANMSIRIFDALAKWVTMDQLELRSALEALEGKRANDTQLKKARRLFAHAVETPGGLKIETIHAFCQRVLKQFPFEANVPAHFMVLQDDQKNQLFDEAWRRILIESAINPHTDIAQSIAHFTPLYGDDDLKKLLNEAYQALREMPDWAKQLTDIANAWGLSGDHPYNDVMHEIKNDAIPVSEWPIIIQALQQGSAADAKKAEGFQKASQATGDEQITQYMRLFFVRDMTHVVKIIATKTINKNNPVIFERLNAEKERLGVIYPRLYQAQIVERTRALIIIATAFSLDITMRKRTMAALDFDDLLQATVDLFTRTQAAWVLYKLDAGLEHLLLDEAQDTNPAQWTILKNLVEEFSVGEGTRGANSRPRTVFAVGDPKQSIYSFQGSAPQEFEDSGQSFKKRLSATGDFQNVSLTLSFRSSPAILSAVDAVFNIDANAQGLSPSGALEKPIHESARPYALGCVQILPLLRPETKSVQDAWIQPVDEIKSSSPVVRNAQRIAQQIKSLLSHGGLWGQTVNAGDVLVLTRKRDAAFQAVIKALKDLGVPVSGSDKLILTDHIAVMDLIVIGKVALNPDDDLTLATVLLSPLIGLNQDDLFTLAAQRGDQCSVWNALCVQSKHISRFEQARLFLQRLIDKAQTLIGFEVGAFGFYSDLLGPSGGRKALIARLSLEAEDVISAFLTRALDYEQRKTPSLLGFLRELETSNIIVKRDMDSINDEVRVMTVHGAKGLEAPIVFILDNGQDSKTHSSVAKKLMMVQNAHNKAHNPQSKGVPLLIGARKQDTPQLEHERARSEQAVRDEHHRLLYVAMTRARDHLIIAPTIGTKPVDPAAGSWSEMIRAGLTSDQAQSYKMDYEHDDDTGLTQWGRWKQTHQTHARAIEATSQISLPNWVHKPVFNQDDHKAANLIKPSIQSLNNQDMMQDIVKDQEAQKRGIAIHALLQHLPLISADKRGEVGREWLSKHHSEQADEVRIDWLNQAIKVIENQDLRDLFGVSSRAEVQIQGRVMYEGAMRNVSGRIDRLAVLEQCVMIADFKTSTFVPNQAHSIPVSHLEQLKIYAAVMKQVYPTKNIECWLIYTRNGTFFKIAL